ncbi:MAG: hypothetical protein LBB78_05100 [Spirochaetaceae bacterium]|jgi:hypothetical protein|nr:hypothetical protein [Spirochaetaceae bacterium]
MNANMVGIIKGIIAGQGTDAARLKGYVVDYASREGKVERLAFGRCIKYGAYNECKNAPDVTARQQAKAAAQKAPADEGLDIALCHDVPDRAFGGRP